METLFDVSGKVVLVTGGSRGLGRGLVQGFAQAGAHVAIVSRKLENCQQLARDIESLGGRAFPYACHVGRWDEIEPMFDAVWDHFGKVDVVINNAGMSPTYPSLYEASEKLVDSVIGVNFKGPFRLCAVAGRRMVEAGGGAIVNMSSIASLYGQPGGAAYGGAKAALNLATEAFAVAYHPKVRVNTVLVGYFNTDSAQSWADPPDSPTSRITRGGQRLALPQDMVSTVIYLASDASKFVTGAQIRVDGGGWQTRPAPAGEVS